MKYTLDQSDTVTALGGATLYRIQYADGTRGGYLQSTANLDPDGDARVRGNARVHGDAWVYGNAQVWATRGCTATRRCTATRGCAATRGCPRLSIASP